MRIVAFSDTHGYYKDLVVPEGDVLVFAGDATRYGSRVELLEFNKWFKWLPFDKKIFVAGNHDMALEKYRGDGFDMDGCVHLLNRSFTWKGVVFYGSPYTPKFGEWAFMRPPEEMPAVWGAIPVHTDVLITHGPPRGIMDVSVLYGGNRVGCEALAAKLPELSKLKVHIFGHIHEGYGQMSMHRANIATGKMETTRRYYNVAICDGDYFPANPVTVIDL